MFKHHFGPLFKLTALFVLLTVALLACLRSTAPGPQGAHRVNTLIQLSLGPGATCEPVSQRGGAVKLFIDGMDTGLDAVGCQDGPTASASFMFRHVNNSRLSKDADEAVWTRILGHPLEVEHGKYGQRT